MSGREAQSGHGGLCASELVEKKDSVGQAEGVCQHHLPCRGLESPSCPSRLGFGGGGLWGNVEGVCVGRQVRVCAHLCTHVNVQLPFYRGF